jgi:hypothetical protein
MALDEDHFELPDLRRSVDMADGEQDPLITTKPPECHGNRHPAARSPALGSLGLVALCFALNILLEAGLYLIAIPLNQILEEIICRNILPTLAGASDPRCKDSIVQSELSLIRGWQVTFDIIPGLLTAVPYGLMADRYGREFVLFLSVLGGALASSFNILICMLAKSDSPPSDLIRTTQAHYHPSFPHGQYGCHLHSASSGVAHPSSTP